MKLIHKFFSFGRLFVGAALLMMALLWGTMPAAHAAATVTVLDSGVISGTSSPTLSYTTSSPNTFMGDPFTLGSVGGTSNVAINGGSVYLVGVAAQTYTDVTFTVYIWGAVNTGTVSAAAPAFSNLLGTYTFDIGALTTTAGGIKAYNFTLGTPLVVPSQSVGVTVAWKGNTGSGLASDPNLTSLIRYNAPFATGGVIGNGYYRNANSEVDGNFTSTRRTLGTNPTNQSIAFDLRATVTEPTVTTTAATNVTSTSATLNGTVNPKNVVTTAQFEYGTTNAYGLTAPITLSPNNGNAVQTVSAAVTGLAPKTLYHYRTSATNAGGTSVGSDQTFTTPALAPTITGFNPPSGTVATSVVITGTDFTGATSVKFNGTAATSVTVDSDTQITATVPTGATTGTISVTTPNGTGTSANTFTVTTPSLTIGNSTVTEGDANTKNMLFVVTLSSASAVPVSVTYTTSDGSATVADNDYNAVTGTLTINPGSTTAMLNVLVNGDTKVEPDETLSVTLSAPTNATLGTPSVGTGTITNDDTAVSVAVAPASVLEDSNTNLVYTFTRTGVTTGALTTNFGIAGTATLGTDYTQTGADTFDGTNGTVTFAANATTAAVTLTPVADSIPEPDETVILTVGTGTGYNPIAPTSATGTITNDDMAIPAITSFTPTSGGVGVSVVITGTNFTGATSVKFNGTTATSVTIDSATQITATVPTGATTGTISVTTPSGTGTSTGTFTVLPTSITNFNPTSGTVGTAVVITGTAFTGTTSVKFNGTAATSVTVNSDTQITTSVPAGATTGPISVTSPSGVATSTNTFTVTTTSITNFNPTSGYVGTSVVITGAGFTGATSVKFNGTAATSVTVNSDTQITVTVPTGATTGTISVTAPGGTATSSNTFTVLADDPTMKVVTTINDVVNSTDGVVSLREAVNYSNTHPGADTISFAIPGATVQTITLGSTLTLSDNATTIDGYTQSGASANTLATGTNAVLRIELRGTGTGTFDGLTITGASCTVRGLSISNCRYGIALNGSTATGNTISGNYLGVRADGTTAAANAVGVYVNGALNTTIGNGTAAARNIISTNSSDGVTITGSAAAGNSVRGNSIYANGTTIFNLGIDLVGNDGVDANDAGDADTGPNGLQNYPVLSLATSGGGNITFRGNLSSTPSTTFTLDFYSVPASDASNYGEGQTYLGSANVTTDASGNVAFVSTISGTVARGTILSATATNPGGSTSEFSKTLVTGQANSTNANNGILISEFRFSGPGGPTDEYIELSNTTGTAVSLTGYSLNASAVTTNLSTIDFTGKSIPAYGHLLVTNSGYSLGTVYPSTYPVGTTTPSAFATGDITYTGDIALTSTLTLNDGNGANVDSVNDLSGTTGFVSTNQYAFVRRQDGPTMVDTEISSNDFNLVDIASTNGPPTSYGTSTLGNGARLGTPSPQNTKSPVTRAALTLVPISIPGTIPEGRYVTKNSPVDPLGRLSLRRTITNNTGQTITQIRFTLVRTTSGTNTDTSIADLRALSSTGVLNAQGVRVVQGIQIEAPTTPVGLSASLSPATTGNGGGLNSSWNVGSLPAGGLAPGQSMNIEFLFGIVRDGNYSTSVVATVAP